MFSKELSLNTTTIKVTKTCSNAVEMKTNVVVVVNGSGEKNDVIALESILVKRISKEYLTMFNIDGSMRKTAKSKSYQLFSR